MAIQDFTAGQVLTAVQMDNLQANDYNQTVSTKTASYTLVAADKGTRVVMNSASATTITVNTSLFSAGDTLFLQNISTGVCTVTAGTATVSSAGPLAIPQNGSGVLYFTSAGVSIFYPSAVTGATQTSAIFNETQASGTNGGTFTSGSYVKRTLNTTVKNDIVGCSLASSVITLPAGTYQVFATANAFVVDRHKLKLRNTTDSTDTQIGTSVETQGASATVATIVQGLFTITASKNFEVQHRCQTTRATDGLGRSTSFGDDEVYCTITITKVA